MHDQIIKFLKERPLLNIAGFERTVGMPTTTINQALSGSRRIPSRYIYALKIELEKYGFSPKSD